MLHSCNASCEFSIRHGSPNTLLKVGQELYLAAVLVGVFKLDPLKIKRSPRKSEPQYGNVNKFLLLHLIRRCCEGAYQWLTDTERKAE